MTRDAALAILLLIAGAGSAGSQGVQTTWAMTAMALDTPPAAGDSRFQGHLQRVRLVCVTSSWGYTVQTPGAPPSSEAKALTHDCQISDRFHIVLPGETLYSPVELRSTKWIDASAIDISVVVVERRKGVQRDSSIQLTWHGTFSDARAAGRAAGF